MSSQIVNNINQTVVTSCLDADVPLVALLPAHSEFDDEAAAAAKSLPVLRFSYNEHLALMSPLPDTPCRALHRGFMLSGERWKDLHDRLAQLGIHLVVSPAEYEQAHYYPNVYKIP